LEVIVSVSICYIFCFLYFSKYMKFVVFLPKAFFSQVIDVLKHPNRGKVNHVSIKQDIY